MANNRNVWDYRDSLDSRMAKMETHVENIYHHVKRIDVLLEKQNGRIRTNEFTLSRWKGGNCWNNCRVSYPLYVNSNGNEIGE